LCNGRARRRIHSSRSVFITAWQGRQQKNCRANRSTAGRTESSAFSVFDPEKCNTEGTKSAREPQRNRLAAFSRHFFIRFPVLSVAFLRVLWVKFRRAQPKTSRPCAHFDCKTRQLVPPVPVFWKLIYGGSGKERKRSARPRRVRRSAGFSRRVRCGRARPQRRDRISFLQELEFYSLRTPDPSLIGRAGSSSSHRAYRLPR
jgi:hypothetical protein